MKKNISLSLRVLALVSLVALIFKGYVYIIINAKEDAVLAVGMGGALLVTLLSMKAIKIVGFGPRCEVCGKSGTLWLPRCNEHVDDYLESENDNGWYY